MTAAVIVLIHITGIYPLLRAWQANRRTTLFQAVHWGLASWAAWGLTLLDDAAFSPYALGVMRYLALCVTSSAGVAVLGARRPGVGPWNFVLLGLLAVMLLPLAEGALARGALHLEGPRLLFLAATLGVLVLNYLPTRLGPAALLVGAGGAVQITLLTNRDWLPLSTEVLEPVGGLLLALAPWAGYERLLTRPPPPSEFDRIWLAFRDRFGLVWSQRLREQFNNSAGHHGWQVVLRWQGLRLLPGTAPPGPDQQEEMLAVLHSLLKRFHTADSSDEE